MENNNPFLVYRRGREGQGEVEGQGVGERQRKREAEGRTRNVLNFTQSEQFSLFSIRKESLTIFCENENQQLSGGTAELVNFKSYSLKATSFGVWRIAIPFTPLLIPITAINTRLRERARRVLSLTQSELFALASIRKTRKKSSVNMGTRSYLFTMYLVEVAVTAAN